MSEAAKKGRQASLGWMKTGLGKLSLNMSNIFVGNSYITKNMFGVFFDFNLVYWAHPKSYNPLSELSSF